MRKTFLTLSAVVLSFLWSVNYSYAQGGLTKPDDASLVGYYMMDEGSGTIVRDSSGTGNNGTTTGSPTWSSGMKGLALGFDGLTQYATVPHVSNLNIAGPITLAAWFRCEATANATARIMAKARQGATDGYELSLASTGKLFFRLNQKKPRTHQGGKAVRRDTRV